MRIMGSEANVEQQIRLVSCHQLKKFVLCGILNQMKQCIFLDFHKAFDTEQILLTWVGYDGQCMKLLNLLCQIQLTVFCTS